MTQRIAQGFTILAPVYDALVWLVFGRSAHRAQLHFLSLIKPDDTVFILGGGTGKLLKALVTLHPNVEIDYIDISPAMINQARKKIPDSARVNFIVGTEHTIPNKTYSIIITNFYLDLFPDKTLEGVIKIIKRHKTRNSHWLVTDFVSTKCWHKFMLWIMYRFFRITTQLEATRLPDWPMLLQKHQAVEINTQKFYGGFIKTSVFRFE